VKDFFLLTIESPQTSSQEYANSNEIEIKSVSISFRKGHFENGHPTGKTLTPATVIP
jgi:hypothetical protein